MFLFVCNQIVSVNFRAPAGCGFKLPGYICCVLLAYLADLIISILSVLFDAAETDKLQSLGRCDVPQRIRVVFV